MGSLLWVPYGFHRPDGVEPLVGISARLCCHDFKKCNQGLSRIPFVFAGLCRRCLQFGYLDIMVDS
jgi:hypothetical protein